MRAQQLYDESAQRFHSLGDEHYAGRATRSLAWAHYEAGDLERARAVNEENLRHARTIDDKLLEGVALGRSPTAPSRRIDSRKPPRS